MYRAGTAALQFVWGGDPRSTSREISRAKPDRVYPFLLRAVSSSLLLLFLLFLPRVASSLLHPTTHHAPLSSFGSPLLQVSILTTATPATL